MLRCQWGAPVGPRTVLRIDFASSQALKGLKVQIQQASYSRATISYAFLGTGMTPFKDFNGAYSLQSSDLNNQLE